MKGDDVLINAKTEIEKALLEAGVKKKDFYKMVGYSTQQQLTNKLRTNSFGLEEFERWLGMLGKELKIVKKEGE